MNSPDSYYGSQTINFAPYRSVVEMMEKAIERYADKVAFRNAENCLTYNQTDEYSRSFAAWLQKMGVKKGDRVALMAPNLLAFPVAMLGIMRAGGIQVNVNPQYTPRELRHQLIDSGAHTIIIFSGSSAVLSDIITDTTVQNVVIIHSGDCGDKPLPSPPVDKHLSHYTLFQDAIDEGQNLRYRRVELYADDLVYLQYTGGTTTGVAKGAALNNHSVIANLTQVGEALKEASRPGQETVITALPLYHIFALAVNLLQYFSLGADNYLIANPRHMDGLMDVLIKSKFSVITGVNTLYNRMILHPEFDKIDFTEVRIAIGGGTAIFASTSEKWKNYSGDHIVEGYGLSEASTVVAFNAMGLQNFSDSVGFPVIGTEIKIVTPSGEESAVGFPGEIWVRGPQIMDGYWQQPEATNNAITEDGYFRTGDIGIINTDGSLSVVDRLKDMVLVSGFNVYPNEVESVVSDYPGVVECACIGVNDEETGETLRLFVVKHNYYEVTSDEIISYCRSELTAYKTPKQVVFVEELPKSPVGKLLRRELRAIT